MLALALVQMKLFGGGAHVCCYVGWNYTTQRNRHYYSYTSISSEMGIIMHLAALMCHRQCINIVVLVCIIFGANGQST